jgi:hypothetical protein
MAEHGKRGIPNIAIATRRCNLLGKGESIANRHTFANIDSGNYCE